MNDLINVNFDNQTISARELHEQLNIKTPFTMWFDRMVEYGFSEGTEFFTKMLETSEMGGRPAKDYEISIDMAKEICMIQRSPEGKRVRQYLIDLEKAWNTPEQVMARALRMADQTIASLKEKTNLMAQELLAMNEKLEEMQPKVTYLDKILESKDTVLVTQIAQDYGMSAKGFNKMLHDLGVQHKIHKQWVLYSKYQGKGYVHSHTHYYEKADGQTGNSLNTEWTQKGRLFLYDFLKQHNKLPLIEREAVEY